MDVTTIGKGTAYQTSVNYVSPVAPVNDAVRTTASQQQTATDASSSPASPASPAVAADSVQTVSAVTQRNLDTVRAIESLHATMNQLVKGVRETNEGLDKAAGQVEKMRQQLDTIVKNFPPFSSDSKERMEILMSYVSLRKEIREMTVPPPPPPVYEKIRSTWQDLIDQNGQILPEAVADVQPASSDAEVATAYDSLGKTGENLASLSSGIIKALVQG